VWSKQSEKTEELEFLCDSGHRKFLLHFALLSHGETLGHSKGDEIISEWLHEVDSFCQVEMNDRKGAVGCD
jgi:hypothetical protein